MSKVINKIEYSYPQIDDMIASLLTQIYQSGRKWSVVVGIANGGLYISRKIAKALRLPHIAVQISWYDGDQKRDFPLVSVNQELSGIYDGSRLIVDDLIDGGSTIRSFKQNYGFGWKDDVAVLFYNKKTTTEYPSYYAEFKPDAWIVFPWEVNNEDI